MTAKQKRVRDNVSVALLKFVIHNNVTDENLALLIKSCEENKLTRLNIICTMANYPVPKEIYTKAKQAVLDKFHYAGDTAHKRQQIKTAETYYRLEAEREEFNKAVCAMVTNILRG